jgi:hypothetical protein
MCLQQHAHIHKSLGQSPREVNSSSAIQQKLKALNKTTAEILAKIIYKIYILQQANIDHTEDTSSFKKHFTNIFQ